jgi:hypothetical protein
MHKLYGYDPMYPDIDFLVFKQCDWKQFYGEVREAFLPMLLH